jgi:Zn-finger nucleic acid-binding protein
MTAALAAAHFAGMHLVVIWDSSAHCPTDFHDCWQVRQPWPSWLRCRSVHIVGQNSLEAKQLTERFHLDLADMSGFAACDVLLREMHSEVAKLLQKDGKLVPEPLDDTLLAMWVVWQPAQRCIESAQKYMTLVREKSGCERVAGIHYRRGDLKKLMIKSYGKKGNDGQTVDYERFDQEFVKEAKQLLEQGHALIICTDTVDGFQFWSHELKGSSNFYFNPSSETRAMNSHGQVPHELRQTSHEEFTTDLCLLMQCERFLGTSESTVRHVVMYGRQQPFSDAKIIGLVPYAFRHLTGTATTEVRNLAKRLALRWHTAPTRGTCEWLSLSDDHALILAALPQQAVEELWSCMMNRMQKSRDLSVHGSWLGATELPLCIEAARSEWKALSKATAGQRAGRRPAGFLSAVTWTRMREWCMSQGQTCPLSWGDRFIMVTRENLMSDMTLLRMLGQADAGTVSVMTEEPDVVETPSASSSGPSESAGTRNRRDVPFPPRAMQVAVSRPKWPEPPAAPPAKRPRM